MFKHSLYYIYNYLERFIYSMTKTSHSPGQLSELAQGDIVWLDLSPTVGHEQADYRPAVVISKQQFNRRALVIVLPITRTPGALKVEINCLPSKSYVMCDQPRALDLLARKYKSDGKCLSKEELEQVLGRLKPIIF